jgi:hypothetical protein
MKNQGLKRQGDAALGYIIFGDSFWLGVCAVHGVAQAIS